MKKDSIFTAWFIVMITYIKHILTLQMIPERATMTYINEKYFYPNLTVYIKRNGRKSKYYFNIEGMNKVTLGNNATLNLDFLELQQNEYKPSFVSGHFKICENLTSKQGLAPYVAAAFVNAGFVCPLPPGLIRIINMSVPADNFPNVWPFERCKIEASLTHTLTNEKIAATDIYARFKQSPRSG